MGDSPLLLDVVGFLLLVGMAVALRVSLRAHSGQQSRGTGASAASAEELVRQGRKIEAIKLYREQHGVGLKEAKDAVDAMSGGRPVPIPKHQDLDRLGLEDLVRAGHKIEAIKHYRERTGVGLKEAKDAIDAIAAGQASPFGTVSDFSSSSASLASVEDALRAGRKIEAIKLYRERTGIGLKEAKDAVDEMERRL